MTSIVLIRHGATEWSGRRYLGRTDLPLSPAGSEAARVLAEELATTVPPDVRIVSSPSLRTRETAAAVAEAVGRGSPVAIETDPRWAEVDVGEAEGLTFEEVEARFPSLGRQLASAEPDIDWPSGETAGAFHARVAAAWTSVLATERPTIVVSHAGSIRVAMALATGRPESDIEFFAPTQALRLEIGD